MTGTVVPALLAGAATVAWWGLPRPASVRVDGLLPRPEPPVDRLVRLQHVPEALVRLRRRLGRRQRLAAERERAVEACSVLASELRAGRPPAAALQAAADVAAGAVATSLRAAAGSAELGGDVAAALAAPSAGEDCAVPELLTGLAACWTVCAGTGSGLAAAVERLGEGQRAAADQRRAVEVELAGPRATARLLALLPVVGLLLAAGLGADPLGFLFGNAAGRGCLLVGLGLEVLGLRWTGRLAAGAAEGG